MRRATCLTCRWWDGQIKEDLTGFDDGICRRYPPRGPGFGWPVTTADEFCGEHAEPAPDVDEMFARRDAR